jgi:hypothetical protein
MTNLERKKLLVELESELRRTETALAVAQTEYEKAYAALWSYMNDEAPEGPRHTIVFSPEVTMH